jgi:hypothetical protein
VLLTNLQCPVPFPPLLLLGLLLLVLRRLVGPTGSPDVARQLMRLRLSAVWVTMVAFEGSVPVPGGMEGERA